MIPHLEQTELELAAEKGDSLLPLERRVHLATCAECQTRRAALAQTVLERGPAPRPERTPPVPLTRGSAVGRYLVLELLGQGGMGTVYAAYDAELDRRVAVKVLRADVDASRSQEAQLRLLREAQAMARISHPNVIAVHDVGTVGDGVFLAMELVEGTTLKGWLRREERPAREILDAFLQAGQGLLAAHRAGLVHRDFKPENVLVRDDGRVFVTDFGLARLATGGGASAGAEGVAGPPAEPLAGAPRPVDPPPGETLDPSPGAAPTRADAGALASALTRAGAVMGTPRYMSPEQHLGKTPDATSDQFSFCAALYWALFRERPFEPQKLAEAAERSASMRTAPLKRESRPAASPILEPPKDAKVSLRVRRAVMRGLSLSPSERFPSLEPLLEQLAPEPRRRVWPWMAGVGLLGIAAAGAVAFVQTQARAEQVCSGAPTKLAGAWDGPIRGRVEQAFLATGVPGAQAQFGRVAQRLDDYATRWAADYHDTCAATAIFKEQPESVLSVRMICLDRHLSELRAVTQLLTRADPALLDNALQVADGLAGLQDCADVASLTQAQPLPADPTVREEIRGVHAALAAAGALKLAGRYPEAAHKAAEVLDRAAPLAYPPLTAEALYLQGTLLDKLAKYDLATDALLRAFDSADAGKVDPLRVRIASELLYLANQRSDLKEGLRWNRSARAVLQRIGPRPDLESGLLENLGSLYLNQARVADAANAYEAALKMILAVPGVPPLEVASYRMNLAGAYSQQSQTREATALIEEVIALYRKTFGPDYPSLANAYMVLADTHLKVHAYDDALHATERAIAIARKAHGPDYPWLIYAEDIRGTILQEARRFEPARQAYLAAWAIAAKQATPNPLDLAYTYGGIGQCLVELNQRTEAVDWLEKAVAIPNPDLLERGNSLFALARALWGKPSARPRALKLAAEAKESYAKSKAAEPLARVTAWLAKR